MDRRPFFVFDLESFDDSDVKELAKFHRDKFDLSAILSTAATLKYTHAAANYLSRQMKSPDEDFVKLVGRQIYDGNMTKTIVDQLRSPVQSAFEQIIRENIQDRIHAAFNQEQNPENDRDVEVQSRTSESVEGAGSEIETTEEEWQGLYIIRAIAGDVLEDVDRVTIRDQKSYCGILFDDNNRQPICRLRFNASSVKYIGIFDEQKTETKHRITKAIDIYKFKNDIRSTIKRYL